MIAKYLDLSVAHFTCDTLESLYEQTEDNVVSYVKRDNRCGETFGVFVNVPDEFDEDENIPKDLKNVFAYARDNDCFWLNIDRDADIIPELPTYDK